MPATGVQRRSCVFNADGGTLAVHLLANNALRAGADFRIVAPPIPPGVVEETWKMAAGDLGAGSHVIQSPVGQLDRNVLAWEILVCAQIPAADMGVIEIQVHQDGVSCPMTKPAQWSLEEVPACDQGVVTPISIRGNLVLLAG